MLQSKILSGRQNVAKMGLRCLGEEELQQVKELMNMSKDEKGRRWSVEGGIAEILKHHDWLHHAAARR